MMNINATGLDYKELNETLREARGSCTITDCLGQRFIAAGISDKTVTISGIPGNALGAYLNGAKLEVKGNAQDAVGDTMNDGTIVIHGSVGDAVGYAMRGGRIYVQGNAGYRAGIHMKAYKDKQPALVIGGRAGSFLGEYQAGGTIIVLGLNTDDKPIVGNFPSTGMHGGKMYLRSDCKGIHFPHQVHTRPAEEADMEEIAHYLRRFCFYFGHKLEELLDHPFTVVTPDSSNPYRQMYVAN
ncbi:MAG: glutamate synthase [Ruminococcus sp.]|nr:glutamate synthase [Ruminococcus sp.]MBR1393941.1 glutamate synthase [Ruminococcus sp.]